SFQDGLGTHGRMTNRIPISKQIRIKKTMVNFTDIGRYITSVRARSLEGPRKLKSMLRRNGLQLLYLIPYSPVIHIDPVDLRKGFNGLVDLTHFLITDSDFVSQRLIFVLCPVRNFKTALKPHYGDLGYLFLLEAHPQHIAAVYAVAFEVLHSC